MSENLLCGKYSVGKLFSNVFGLNSLNCAYSGISQSLYSSQSGKKNRYGSGRDYRKRQYHEFRANSGGTQTATPLYDFFYHVNYCKNPACRKQALTLDCDSHKSVSPQKQRKRGGVGGGDVDNCPDNFAVSEKHIGFVYKRGHGGKSAAKTGNEKQANACGQAHGKACKPCYGSKKKTSEPVSYQSCGGKRKNVQARKKRYEISC
jgi:hypothetical protein